MGLIVSKQEMNLASKEYAFSMSMSHYFNLVWHLVKRDFYLRHTGSALGVLWSLLVPVAQLGVLSFTFSSVIRIDTADYPAFIYSALLPWTWFSSSLSSAGNLFFIHRDLLRRPAFPPSVLVIVNTLSHLIPFLLSLPLLYGLMGWYGRFVIWNPVTFLSLVLIQGLLTIGLSFVIATWNVFYRDIAPLVGMVLSLLFFLTPIFYRPIVDSKYRMLLELNPMVTLINSYRAVLFEGTYPKWEPLILIGGVSILVCGLGYFIHKRLVPDVVDAI
jgi:lipopolysaccharide transport system permease protein